MRGREIGRVSEGGREGGSGGRGREREGGREGGRVGFYLTNKLESAQNVSTSLQEVCSGIH